MIEFLRANARWIGGGFLLTFLSSFGQTFFISLSSDELRAEFALSHGEFGGIYMLATLASAASLPFIGRIVDWLTVRATVLVIVPALAVACLLMAIVPSVTVLVLAIYGLRLFGQGMMTHTAMTAMGRWYAAQRGRAVSLVALGHQVGEMALPLAFVAVAAAGLGWRGTWIACALLLLVLGLPVASGLLARERTPRGTTASHAGSSAADWTRRQVMGDPLFWVAMTGILAPPFIGTTIFFHQDYLVALNGWSPVAFASGFVLLGATTITSGLVTGALVDRFSAVGLLPIFLLPLAASCAVIGLAGGEWSIFAFFFLLGVSYGVSQTLFGAIWPEMYGTRHLGSIRSGIVAMMVFATAAGPGVTGWLIDTGVSLPVQMRWAALYCVLGAGILLVVSRAARRRRSVAMEPVAA